MWAQNLTKNPIWRGLGSGPNTRTSRPRIENSGRTPGRLIEKAPKIQDPKFGPIFQSDYFKPKIVSRRKILLVGSILIVLID
jgi:hypothetical protein